jgi:hypothetical protein
MEDGVDATRGEAVVSSLMSELLIEADDLLNRPGFRGGSNF